MKEWLVFEALGVAGRRVLVGRDLRPPDVFVGASAARQVLGWVVGAFVGGALFGIGAQFGRGCTSGAALSGMAVLSAGGFVTMLAIFGSAYAVAYFFRKLWI